MKVQLSNIYRHITHLEQSNINWALRAVTTTACDVSRI